jgi:hypothetical protein
MRTFLGTSFLALAMVTWTLAEDSTLLKVQVGKEFFDKIDNDSGEIETYRLEWPSHLRRP